MFHGSKSNTFHVSPAKATPFSQHSKSNTWDATCAEAQGQGSQSSQAAVAAAERCLAAARRLPPLDWGTPLHHMLDSHTADSGTSQSGSTSPQTD